MSTLYSVATVTRLSSCPADGPSGLVKPQTPCSSPVRTRLAFQPVLIGPLSRVALALFIPEKLLIIAFNL